MKVWSCALGCLGALVASVVSIVALVGLAALAASLEPEGWETPTKAFTSSETADGWDLSFGFSDHNRRPHRVSCRVQRVDLERELGWFGFSEEVVWGELNRQMEEAMNAEIRRRNVQKYFQIETSDHGVYKWEWRVDHTVPEPEHSRAIEASRRVGRWIEEIFPERRRELKKQLVTPHGFRVDMDGDLVIDYARLVDSGGETLASCRQALVEVGAGSSWRRHLSIFLAFFQDLEYQLPPLREEGRFTLGLWVPTEVLVRGKGDCDSKSVALASMLRRLGRRVLFILLPGHALIGVEMRPAPGEHFVRLGNRHFVLSDPAGPGRIPPGGQAISGNYEYILIEPAGR